jgi:exopolyphosphatase
LAHIEEVSAISNNQQITHLLSVQSLSATLGEKKLSVSHLSTRDLLRRDYKEYVFSMPVSEDATQFSNVIKVGLATVPLRLSAFFASSSYPTKEIQDWFAERDLSVLGILTTFGTRKARQGGSNFGYKGIAEKVWQGLESSEVLEVKSLISQRSLAAQTRQRNPRAKMLKNSRVMKRALGSHMLRGRTSRVT